MKRINLFAILFLFFCGVSCNKDDDEPLIQPSATLIEMEGEGGETDVFIAGEDWHVAGVINKNGNVNISGDSYSIDGNLIRENYTLALEGLGRMDALWPNKGFSIVRNTPSSLKVAVKENSTGEDFSFVVMLQSGEELKEITVEQKKSQGYQFDSIEYALKEGDGDSLFISRSSTYRFNIQTSTEFSFSPVSGVNVNKKSYFESMEDDAFVWLDDDSVMVKIPSDIYNNEVYYNGENGLYTNVSTVSTHGFEEQMETVTVPVGKSEFFTEIQYHKRKVSYSLVLINNRTKEEKTIEGKWIEIAPTGEYTVTWKDNVE